MAGLFEQLNAQDQAKVRSWSESARKSEHKRDIPPELFVGAKLGFYYGWEALLAFKLGYVITIDENGKSIRIPYTFEDAVADATAADKVNYRNLIDNGDIIASANISSRNVEWAKSACQYSNKIRKEYYG